MSGVWETLRLSEVCRIRPPKSEARSLLREDDLVSFLPMEDLGVFQKQIVAVKERKLKDVSGSYTYFADNDVLLAKITPCFENGKLGIATNLKNGVGFGSSEYVVFRPDERLLPEYLFYFLSLDEFREEGKRRMMGSVGHKRVSLEFIENTSMPVPPIEEQRRIVAILDDAFAAIDKAKANTEKNIQNARELFDSYLNNIFSNPGPDWASRMIDDVCVIVNGGTPKTGVDKYWNGQHLWITPAEMGKLDSPYVDETRRRLSDAGLANSSARLMPPNSVILSSRAPIGHLVINTKPMATNQGCKGLVPKEGLNYKFLYYFLSGNVELLNSLGTGATFKELSATALKNVAIPVPSFEEQGQIIRRVDGLKEEAQRLNSVNRDKIAELDELKRSILQKAFEGEL